MTQSISEIKCNRIERTDSVNEQTKKQTTHKFQTKCLLYGILNGVMPSNTIHLLPTLDEEIFYYS
jgi:hypothetical protein